MRNIALSDEALSDYDLDDIRDEQSKSYGRRRAAPGRANGFDNLFDSYDEEEIEDEDALMAEEDDL